MRDNPVFIEEDVVHYCVANIASVVARTASQVLLNSAIPYITEIANNGIDAEMKNEPSIEAAVNTHQGKMLNIVRLSGAEVKE